MRWLCLFAVMWPGTAAALEICDELWFIRNLVQHRAGYCFNSVLGQVIFDNDDCNPAGAALSEADKVLIAKVRAFEVEDGCAIDSSQTKLNVDMIEQRKALVDLPFPSWGESACIGWQGRRMSLRAERFVDGPVIGAARTGDMLMFQFEDVDGWSFVQVFQNDVPAGMGWAEIALEDLACDSFAG